MGQPFPAVPSLLFPAELIFSSFERATRRRDYFDVISTDACVFSHSSRIVQPFPVLSNAIVKFSTGAEVFDTFISIRARSFSGPG